jgi:hypothetical protein
VECNGNHAPEALTRVLRRDDQSAWAFDILGSGANMGDPSQDCAVGYHDPALRHWQTADIQFRGLRILFDDRYKEQLRLVDVLLDRLRMLGGAGRVLAGLLLPDRQRIA